MTGLTTFFIHTSFIFKYFLITHVLIKKLLLRFFIHIVNSKIYELFLLDKNEVIYIRLQLLGGDKYKFDKDGIMKQKVSIQLEYNSLRQLVKAVDTNKKLTVSYFS